MTHQSRPLTVIPEPASCRGRPQNLSPLSSNLSVWTGRPLADTLRFWKLWLINWVLILDPANGNCKVPCWGGQPLEKALGGLLFLCIWAYSVVDECGWHGSFFLRVPNPPQLLILPQEHKPNAISSSISQTPSPLRKGISKKEGHFSV